MADVLSQSQIDALLNSFSANGSEAFEEIEANASNNVKNYDFCATRLRFEVVDSSKVDEAACKAAGAVGVIRPTAETAQVIIGTQVQAVYDELKKLA